MLMPCQIYTVSPPITIMEKATESKVGGGHFAKLK